MRELTIEEWYHKSETAKRNWTIGGGVVGLVLATVLTVMDAMDPEVEPRTIGIHIIAVAIGGVLGALVGRWRAVKRYM